MVTTYRDFHEFLLRYHLMRREPELLAKLEKSRKADRRELLSAIAKRTGVCIKVVDLDQ